METKTQEAIQIMNSSRQGILYFKLPDAEMEILRKKGDIAHRKFAPQINKLYAGDTYRPANFLQEVQDYIGYQRP
jgi:hypothetical protein